MQVVEFEGGLLPRGSHQTFRGLGLLGGSWDLVTIHKWGYYPTYKWGNPYTVI